METASTITPLHKGTSKNTIDNNNDKHKDKKSDYELNRTVEVESVHCVNISSQP